MNFKNNISTTREQSKRLLDLGMKPETADMYYWYEGNPYYCPYSLKVQDKVMPYELREEDVPSWSLSRLLEMIPYSIKHQAMKHNLFDALIDMIGWLIDKGHFNEDYLIHSNSSKTGKEDDK